MYEKVAPLLRIPESNIPFGVLGIPEVALWLLPAQVQSTVSPTWAVIVLGLKFAPPWPTVMFLVAAGARTGTKRARRARSRKCIREIESALYVIEVPDVNLT
jgi:hypothetical protein